MPGPIRRCLLCGRRVIVRPLHWLHHFADLLIDLEHYEKARRRADLYNSGTLFLIEFSHYDQVGWATPEGPGAP